MQQCFGIIFRFVSVALPALSIGPSFSVGGQPITIEVSWKDWSQADDYGTGPVDFYYVHFWSEGIDNKEKASSSPIIFTDIERGVFHTIWVGAVRAIDGIEYEGNPGPNVTIRINCVEVRFPG